MADIHYQVSKIYGEYIKSDKKVLELSENTSFFSVAMPGNTRLIEPKNSSDHLTSKNSIFLQTILIQSYLVIQSFSAFENAPGWSAPQRRQRGQTDRVVTVIRSGGWFLWGCNSKVVCWYGKYCTFILKKIV